MEMDKLAVLVGGVGLIVFVYVWFLTEWGKGKGAAESKDKWEIEVKGGYHPDVVRIKRGKEATIGFLRRDSSACLEEVVIPDLGVSKFLPLGERVSVTLIPKKSGKYDFSCGMRMFHGKLIVED